ncbi:MAG: alpha/beta fold hydrolase [Thermodesulfobacteriota bacterium]
MKVIFIHGWATNSKVWLYQKPILEALRAVAIDLPGHVGADKWYESSFRPGIEKLQGLIGGEDTVAIGWSLGGNLLLSLAIQGCENLKGIVLIGSSPSFIKRPHFSHGQSRTLVMRMKKDLKKAFHITLDRFYRTNFSEAERKNSAYQNHLEVLRSTQEGLIKDDMIHILDTLIAEDMVKDVSSINIPALLIHGSLDIVCPVGASYYLLKELPIGELMVMDGAGHCPFITRHKEFNAAVKGFIDRI